MAEMRKRTSMSVPEMGRMLGLGKTESYWLIKKNYFKTILVGNTMRVMIDSFEECLGYIVRPFTISLPMKILSLSRLAGISELPKRALKNGITIRPATS